ncbi:hypothetical protein ACIGKR_17785 [Rhodococcus qingshengii]|uniref:hypothetical protein n=1 Tax=Rhodococcus qingshengii TaxID=334542 RepID=UPI0037CAF3C7
MTTSRAHENGTDQGIAVPDLTSADENHPPTKQEQISMNDDISVEVTQEAIDRAADAAMTASCNERIESAAEITTALVRELLGLVKRQRGPLYEADEDQCECIAFRMSHSDDKEWQRTEFWANVFKLEFENSSPQGFEWQRDDGLWVHDEPLNEYPRVTAESGSNVVQIHRFDRMLSDGTVTPMVGIEAPNGELTYDEVHTLIDQLKDAARSLVAAEGKGCQ